MIPLSYKFKLIKMGVFVRERYEIRPDNNQNSNYRGGKC